MRFRMLQIDKILIFFILLQDLLKKSMNDVFYIHLNVCVSTLKVFYVDGEDVMRVLLLGLGPIHDPSP